MWVRCRGGGGDGARWVVVAHGLYNIAMTVFEHWLHFTSCPKTQFTCIIQEELTGSIMSIARLRMSTYSGRSRITAQHCRAKPKAVSAYFTSQQILPYGFVWQNTHVVNDTTRTQGPAQ